MPKFCANLTMLFNEHAFLDRFDAAAAAGFKGVEFLFPYAFPKEQVAEKLHGNKLTQVLFNLPGGDWEKGERGLGCLPDRVGEFQDGVGKAIEYAKALDGKMVNCLAGLAPAGVDRDKARQTLIDNLAFAAAALKREGILLIMEPINSYDIPGYFVNRSAEGIAIIDATSSDNLKLQYDIYHMQRMEGELAATIAKLLPRIAHMQLADNPGRNEPGTGEINYDYLFGHIDRLGYSGWIGCEYKPKAGTVEGLGWLQNATR
ncbi:hydroxypyruvate isomerase [Hyphomicrobiales bacterium]|nr:hydroxypyruvate isomerase [Hyphomicrobiales bacterium]CAH1700464.1 hydroxypyruvate isomerase [Hyphomicrobiales bacterium]CAI0343655.1 hydroxypyruvate isomerase [Hyphomicrobiales bacterium]